MHHDMLISNWGNNYRRSGGKVISNLVWLLSWSMSKMYHLHNSLNHKERLSTSITVLHVFYAYFGKRGDLIWCEEIKIASEKEFKKMKKWKESNDSRNK